MTDIPIIFSAAMVNALLDGRKTMTRRIFKRDRDTPPGWDGQYGFSILTPDRHVELRGYDPERGPLCRFMKVKYAKRDRLWVRESHRLTDCDCTEACRGPGHVWYEANSEGYRNVASNRLRPSIHMPRWASRLTLIVTSTKVEPLQNLTEADALREGVVRLTDQFDECFAVPGTVAMSGTNARDCFQRLWNSLHGPDAWDTNPDVIAVSFRVVPANIDSEELRSAA